MKNLIGIILVLFLLAPVAVMATPASDASIKELLNVSEARKLIDSMLTQVKSQMETAMNGAVQQNLQGKSPNQAQQRAIDNVTKKMAALVADACSYDKMEPKFLPAYRETFSEEEVTGIIAFYKTQIGQAVIHKMPTLLQKTMSMQMESVREMIPKMQEIEKQFVAEMKQASK